SDIGERAAGAPELRLQHAGRDASNIRDKFRVGGGSLNQERNGRAAALAVAAFASAEHAAEHAAEVPSAGSAHGTDGASGERRGNLEVEFFFRAQGTAAAQFADARNHREKIFRAQPVGSHMDFGGHFFDLEILAGLETGQGGNRGHLRAEVKSFQFGVEQAD